MSVSHDIPVELTAPEDAEPMPLLAAIRELQEIVGGHGHINVGVHQVPVEVFAHDSVTGMSAHTSDRSTWLSGSVKIGEHVFSIYSVHFTTTVEPEPEEALEEVAPDA